MRAFLLCAVSLCLAFAPAPLPRRERTTVANDLQKMQGQWYEGGISVTVEGDRLRFHPNNEYKIVLDTSTRPRRITFIQGNAAYPGIYRFEGSDILWQANSPGNQFPTDLETSRRIFTRQRR